MSILGVVLRTRPEQAQALMQRLTGQPGVDVTHNPGDGRLVLVIEDAAERSAAATLGELALWPEVMASSLVYEYSGEDAPPPAAHWQPGWRTALQELDGGSRCS